MKKIIVFVVALVLVPVSAAAQQPGCDTNFHLVHSTGDGFLRDVDLTSPNDGWAVGYDYNDQNGRTSPLVVRFDDSSFENITPTFPAGSSTGLAAVEALSPTDVYAAGYTLENLGVTDSFITHWDGETWQQMSAPSPGIYTDIHDIAGTAPNDLWVVGSFSRRGGELDSLVLHFDGTEWTRVRVPSIPRRVDGLFAVDSTSASDVWAGGFKGSQKPFLLHFDGTSWTRQAVGSLTGSRNNLFIALDAVAQQDVWATGHGLAAHLTQDGWQVTDTPNVRGTEWFLGIAADQNEAWSVGYRFASEESFTFAMHWDDAAWTRVEVEGRRGELQAVALDSSGTAWAVGWIVDPDTALHQSVIQKACS